MSTYFLNAPSALPHPATKLLCPSEEYGKGVSKYCSHQDWDMRALEGREAR